MSAVLLACGHGAEVDHVRGDRRVQCACGGVSKVSARPATGVVYDVTDITPQPAGEAGAVNLLVVALAFVLGVAIVVTIILFSHVDDATSVQAIDPAPARDLAEPPTTSTTTTTVAVLEERVVDHTKALRIDVATDGIEAAIVAAFSRFGADVAAEAVDVAICESNLDPGETGDAGERGLLQLHPIHRDWIDALGFGWDRMYEVEPNLAAAAHLYQIEGGWGPWTCAP